MVEVGGMVTKCYPLSVTENLICVGFGFISIPWGYLIKLIPSKYFEFKVDDFPMDEAGILALFEGIQTGLNEIYALEKQALESLKNAISN